MIAQVCGVATTLNPEVQEFRRVMDDLNRFMRYHDMPTKLRMRLREYFHQTKHLQLQGAYRNVQAMMSPLLQAEVAMHCNRVWMKQVWFFEKAEIGFLMQIALRTRAMVFTPNELLSPGFLYIVHRGIASFYGRIMGRTAVWGEDVILEAASLRLPYAARALSYLEVYYVTRDELLDVANFSPTTKRYLRSCVLKLAIRRGIVRLAREFRAEQALKSACHDVRGARERNLARARSKKACDAAMRCSRSSRCGRGGSVSEGTLSRRSAKRSVTSGFDAAFTTVKQLASTKERMDHTSDASLVSAAGGIGCTGSMTRLSMSLAPAAPQGGMSLTPGAAGASRKLSTLDTRLARQMQGQGDPTEPSCVHATGACLRSSVHGFAPNILDHGNPMGSSSSGIDGTKLQTKVQSVAAEQADIKAELSLMRQGLTRLLEHAGLQPLEPASNGPEDAMAC